MITRLSNAQLKLVIFDVGGQCYALSASQVERIVPLAEVEPTPGAPNLLFGFLNLAGAAIPVVRLSSLFQVTETKLGLWTPLIIISGTPQRCALLVDSVTQVLSVDEQLIRPLPADSAFNDCVSGMFRTAEKSVMVLAVDRLLMKKEQRSIAGFQKVAERRLNELSEADA